MTEFAFLYPLWLTALLPLGGLIYWYANSRSSSGLIASHIARHLGLQQKRDRRPVLILLAVSWFIAVFALAGPSVHKQARPAFSSDSARVLILDMSRSLYATDIKPNRLSQLKYKALDLLPLWPEGSTGLIAYAGDAYTLSPLTADASTLSTLIKNLSPELMPYPGADAGAAIALAIDTLNQAGYRRGDLILLADDIDDREAETIRDLLDGSAYRLSILAVGSAEGAPISQPDGSLLTNSAGVPVVARTSLNTMRELATAHGGEFIPVQIDNRDVERIGSFTAEPGLNAKHQQRQEFEERVNSGFWLLPLLLLPALGLFRKGMIFTLALFLFPLTQPQPAHASPWQNADQRGYKQFRQGQFAQAGESFRDPYWQGLAHYQAGDYQGAIDKLVNADSEDGRYNLANAYAQSGQLDKATELYQQILADNPGHQDAQENLDIVREQQQQQQQQDSGQPDQQNKSEQQSQSQQSPSQQNQQQGQQSDASQQQKGQQQEDNQQTSGQQSTKQASGEQSDKQPESGKQAGDEQQTTDPQARPDKAPPDPAGSEQARPEQAQPAPKDPQEENADPAATSAQDDISEQVDPALRKLEQVEQVRDPGRLLRAQMLLQAQEKQAPKNSGKTW